jgi:hypothetical protein
LGLTGQAHEAQPVTLVGLSATRHAALGFLAVGGPVAFGCRHGGGLLSSSRARHGGDGGESVSQVYCGGSVFCYASEKSTKVSWKVKRVPRKTPALR